MYKILPASSLNKVAADCMLSGSAWSCQMQALHFLHNHNILHLDVKPDNLFRDSNGSFKLGDFGLAVMRSAQVGSAARCCR